MTDTLASRREALKCLGFGGATLFTLSAGIVAPFDLADAAKAKHAVAGAPFFVQISDTHIGFKKPANMDVAATLDQTIAKIAALPRKPDFVLHTGDITHLATEEQFATAQQLLSALNLPIFYVPGEHDIVDGKNSKPYAARFAPKAVGDGWYSFDAQGVHFVALVNVLQFVDAGAGQLGPEQLAWLKADLAPLKSSTPVVVYSHFPLWPLYVQWGWTTSDGAEALALLQRFGSVTALNGHIHQLAQKTEGKIVFHAARSTAFPQPAPGTAIGPGPLVVPVEQLQAHLGLSTIKIGTRSVPAAINDETLDV